LKGERNKMSLSETLKNMRQKAFMSQESFANELNVSVATINRWENGRAKPNITAMNKIKTFCENKKLPFDEIENEWFNYSYKEINRENKV